MATGTPKAIGFLMASQRPLDEHYLNEGADWADVATALAGIPSGSRSSGKLVMIAGALYKFKANLTELELAYAQTTLASGITIADAGGLYGSSNVEDALAEVKTQADTLQTAIENIASGGSIATIMLPAGSLAAKVAGAVSGTDYPTGWTLAVDSSVNLSITHGLTGKKVAGINVFEISGSDERMLPPFAEAYSGVVGNGLNVKIEGFAPTTLAVRIEIFFNL